MDRNVSVPLYYNAKIAGDYTIDFKLLNFELPMNIYLEDLETGSMTDLYAESYNFSTEQTEDNNRFIIHFIPFNKIETETVDSNTTTGIQTNDLEKFNIYSSSKTVFIKANEKVKEGQVMIVDMNGKVSM